MKEKMIDKTEKLNR